MPLAWCWVKEHKADDTQAFRGNGKLTPEQKELRDLKIRVKPNSTGDHSGEYRDLLEALRA